MTPGTYIIECIPNVSCADPAILREMELAITAVPGIDLRFTDPGSSANRTVFTYLGPATQVFAATAELFRVAAQHIDMRHHEGVHPRTGAVDICPFVLLDDAKYADDLKNRVHQFAVQMGERGHSIYFYEKSASRSDRRELAHVRKGGYEALAGRWERGDVPDLGPRTWTEQAAKWGATVLGVRDLMVAYNVNISGGPLTLADAKSEGVAAGKNGASDLGGLSKVRAAQLATAKTIAGKIRAANGGLPGVKSIGWYLPDLDQVQVSCNLTKPAEAGVCAVFERVKTLAEELGFEVDGSELIGCIPADQLLACSAADLGFGRFKPFTSKRILPLLSTQ